MENCEKQSSLYFGWRKDLVDTCKLLMVMVKSRYYGVNETLKCLSMRAWRQLIFALINFQAEEW